MPAVRTQSARTASRNRCRSARCDGASDWSARQSSGSHSALTGRRVGAQGSGILEGLTGVRVTQSAITQDAMKQSEAAVGARYQTLRARCANSRWSIPKTRAGA